METYIKFVNLLFRFVVLEFIKVEGFKGLFSQH